MNSCHASGEEVCKVWVDTHKEGRKPRQEVKVQSQIFNPVDKSTNNTDVNRIEHEGQQKYKDKSEKSRVARIHKTHNVQSLMQNKQAVNKETDRV